jgi:hypothetical protein
LELRSVSVRDAACKSTGDCLPFVFDRPVVIGDVILKDELRLVADVDRFDGKGRPDMWIQLQPAAKGQRITWRDAWQIPVGYLVFAPLIAAFGHDCNCLVPSQQYRPPDRLIREPDCRRLRKQ